ncbi:MAG: hypothetical protein P0S96_04510 [Simkaniaceae bacterium]|nr:hypothetical protein [Candidatus Sacchlamyda saccharinae]
MSSPPISRTLSTFAGSVCTYFAVRTAVYDLSGNVLSGKIAGGVMAMEGLLCPSAESCERIAMATSVFAIGYILVHSFCPQTAHLNLQAKLFGSVFASMAAPSLLPKVLYGIGVGLLPFPSFMKYGMGRISFTLLNAAYIGVGSHLATQNKVDFSLDFIFGMSLMVPFAFFNRIGIPAEDMWIPFACLLAPAINIRTFSPSAISKGLLPLISGAASVHLLKKYFEPS